MQTEFRFTEDMLMARIRTIKPEFPQSESMGRCSREARLLFILIWTIADDAGRARAAVPLLASLLFPYDPDAPGLMGDWLTELEREGCIYRYQVGGSTYLQVINWTKHQRINRPSGPQCPEPPPDAASRNTHGGLTEDSVRAHGGLTAGSGSGPLPLPLPGPRSRTARPKRAAPCAPEWLTDLKAIYPKRAGDQAWRKAERAGNARIAEGHTAVEILDGARRYAEYVRASGTEGTSYVKQAATFLGPDKPFMEAWQPPPSKADVRYATNANTAREWAAEGAGT